MPRSRERAVLLALLGFMGAGITLEGCEPPGGGASAKGQGGEGAGTLETPWTGAVSQDVPLPDYPRPQMVREDWVNLNGVWELAVVSDSGEEPAAFPDRILVPFPVESRLSGVSRSVSPTDRMWYRRTFSIPDPDEGEEEGPPMTRWLLHFGAVDWDAEVFLNGRSVARHRGGYDPFTVDLTETLADGDEQVLTVAVRDPTDEGAQPRGKQVLDPHGIWYTAVSGIWQTVWLEGVPDQYISAITITPDLSGQRAMIRVETEGEGPAPEVTVVALATGQEASRATGRPGEEIDLPVPDPHLWSPDDPFLYDLRVSLSGGDEVRSYFGMRSVGIGPDEDGNPRLLLNGEPLFQFGLLDQGWWPDGLYTAPTDEALAFDIRKTRELGFNLIRKHVKVEPARWYYHADREGVLVWQDMPSGNNETSGARQEFARELERVVDALRNHPSIVMWVPFNEGWGQHDTEAAAGWVKAHDPTRLVNPASGWTDEGGGDVLDIHRYPGPAAPPLEALPRWAPPPRRYPDGLPVFPEIRVPVLGEFGGLGLPLPGHTWVDEENWGYRSYETLEELNRAYRDLLFQLRPLVGEGLAAAVYTQTTDVEVEVNGVMTYDRRITKLSEESVEANRALFGPPPVLPEVLPTSRLHAQPWRYSEAEPAGDWTAPTFDDSAWRQGPGGFGTEKTPGARVGTPWSSPDLWLRREFELDSSQLQALQSTPPYLRIHHDEDAEVYLNGVRIAGLEGYTTGYVLVPISHEAVDLFREGLNVLAVHVRQTDGGQFIDAGIVEWKEGGD